MSAPCPRAVRAAILLALLTVLPCAADANTLPPGPVMGHPADYVIVTPAAFATEFQQLARWKTRLGIPAIVKTIESIVAEYPAAPDDAERVRMFLQDAHAQWGTHWVLLGGVPPFVPARRVHNEFYVSLDYVTDHYFAALTGSWDGDGDGIYGEGGSPGDQVDLHSDVFVGRAPVRSAAEARDFVAKTVRVSFEPIAPTPHRLLLAGEVFLPSPWTLGQLPTLDGAELAEQIATDVAGVPGIEIQRLYQNWPPYPGATDYTRASLLDALRAGADFFVPMDRGGPLVMTVPQDSITAADLAGLGDAVRPTQAWLVGSTTGNFEGDCLAANFVRGATGGAATCVAPSTLVFTAANQNFVRTYVPQLYPPNAKRVGEALAFTKETFAPYANYDGVVRLEELGLNLFGDPETRLRGGPSPQVVAAYPAQVLAGAPGFDVDVTRGGSPLAGATVAVLVGDQSLAIATTDAAGRAHLVLDPGSAGPADVTVTAADGGRFAGTLTVGAVTAVGGARPGVSLELPQPNPAFVSVRFSGAVAGPASLEVFDIGGRHVRSFVLEAGRFDLAWDLGDETGRRVAPGLYLARVASEAGVRVQRILVGR